MKGQYRIVGEVLIFTVGILIAYYVIINFQVLQDATNEFAMSDQLSDVTNIISAAVVKAAMNENSNIIISVPEKLSDNAYMITLQDDSLILSYLNTDIKATKKIFNINKKYVISGSVLSTAKFIEIVNDGKIRLRR